MSTTTTTTPTDSSVTPTPSPSQPSNNGGGPSSSLYLFTFLATLFLLLFVSSAIILRSFILRQRFRRRIEQAIISGVIVPNHPGGRSRSSRRRAIGEKPKLWQAWVSPAYGNRWDAIVPVSALHTSREQLTKVEEGGTSPPVPPRLPSPVPPPPVQTPRRPFYERLLRNPFSQRLGSSSPDHPHPPRFPVSEPMSFDSPPGLSRQQNAPSSTLDRLQVTVLIAMPDARRPHMDGTAFALPGHSKGKERSLDLDYDEDDLPEMVLGMTELQYNDTIVTPKSA